MIPVLWLERMVPGPAYGVRDRNWNTTCHMLNESFTANGCEHHWHVDTLSGSGAVVVVHAGDMRNDVELLNRCIEKLPWVLLVLSRDEAGLLPVPYIKHNRMKIYFQHPKMYHAPLCDRFFPCGYPADCPGLVKNVERDLDWFFAGQVTHTRRIECVQAMRELTRPGEFHAASSFGSGLSHPEYYEKMSRAKIVPCPSGPATQDTIRVYEALEAGCVPIVDAFCPRTYERGFWNLMLGADCPLPVIEDWNTLPQRIEQELADWPNNQQRCISWWKAYKADFKTWLKQDVECLTQ